MPDQSLTPSAAAALKDLLLSHRAAYVRAAARAVAQNPGQGEGKYAEADLGQMVDGFVAVLGERLDGNGRAAWDFYFQTVIPGLLAAGEELGGIVHTVVAWAVFVVDDVSASIGDQHRAQVVDWLSSFFGAYMADLVRTGLRPG